MTSFLDAEPKQFTLKDDGQIYYQADATNPLPGDPVARLEKGASNLAPAIILLDNPALAGVDPGAAQTKLADWLALHIAKVLEPLVKMTAEMDALPQPVQAICTAVHDALGIVPRQDLMEPIEALDAEMRKTLRARHVRLGPVLAFVPDLNKPAAVRLRAILWSVMNGQPLPAPVPKDGAVSVVVADADANPAFYQAIGYPLYGARAIRIDMLDRVIGAVYENVKDNHFMAKHQMAEWLGCSIPDLYKVLEAMGHRKTYDPAEHVDKEQNVAQIAAVIPNETEAAVPAPEPVTEAAPESAAVPDATAKPKEPVAKPDLATFRVWWPRKAGSGAAPAKKTPPPFERLDPAEIEARNKQKEERRNKFKDGQKEAGDKRPKSDRDHSGGTPARHDRKKKPTRTDKNLRIVSSAPAPAAKVEDSPFAILSTIKFKE